MESDLEPAGFAGCCCLASDHRGMVWLSLPFGLIRLVAVFYALKSASSGLFSALESACCCFLAPADCGCGVLCWLLLLGFYWLWCSFGFGLLVFTSFVDSLFSCFWLSAV
ncbi:hypothetical protein SLA2020_264570 [Shorea laevis]